MSEQEVNDAMAGGAAAFILSDKPHERDYRKTLLKRCALATMQLWNDLEQEERAGRKALA